MNNKQPLSPHITIHKKLLTSIFSIFHRATGIALSIGSIIITFWIAIIALGPDYFFIFTIFSSNFLFKIILIFWTISIFYHLFNGIRYLFWSFSIGMDLSTVYATSYLVFFLTILSTAIVWIVA